MNQDARQLAGICGLYCGTCPSYLAQQKNDIARLAEQSRLKGIPVEEVICNGCHSDRVAPRCVNCAAGFRQCATEKNVMWCFQCDEFPCQRLRDFRDVHVVNGISHHEHVIEDLQYMKEHGVEQWVEEQEKAGRCPQCGEMLYWFVRECPNCQTKIR